MKFVSYKKVPKPNSTRIDYFFGEKDAAGGEKCGGSQIIQ